MKFNDWPISGAYTRLRTTNQLSHAVNPVNQ